MAYKWYTRARKFPQLIGRTPDGTRIPWGPYTVTQVLGGIVTCFVTSQILKVWSPGDIVSSAVVLLLVSGSVVFFLGKLPPGMRNPLIYLKGVLKLFFVRGCRLSGKSLPDLKASHASASIEVAEIVTETPPIGVAVKSSNATKKPKSNFLITAWERIRGFWESKQKPARRRVVAARQQTAASSSVQTPEQVVSHPSPALTGVQRLLLENKS